MDVALATCVRLPEPDHDEHPTLAALHAIGLDAKSMAWDDPTADFAAARMTIVRATWNYPESVERFLTWVNDVAAMSRLWNPAKVIRRNVHKRYLLDLQAAGLPVVPTHLVAKGDPTPLATILQQNGWGDAVVKPAVGAGSYMTIRVSPQNAVRGEHHLRAIVAHGDALVQPFLPSVEDYGERAVVWIDGEITHAVRKSPRFAGQEESTSGAVAVSANERTLARRAISWVGEPLLFARVDMAPGEDGNPMLMELELVEPSLFLWTCDAALDRFAAAVQRSLGAKT